MSEEIRIFQEILKQNGKFDLAYKFEKAKYKTDFCGKGLDTEWYELTFFVDSKYCFELSKLDKQDCKFLIQILNAMHFAGRGTILKINFKINTDLIQEEFDDVLYLFVDESGDMDFSQKGSKYYMFSFLLKRRPFRLHETIASYRYSLLERNLTLKENQARLNLERFHACEDNIFVKKRIFELISSFEQDRIKIYSYILEKSKVYPDKTLDKAKFYSENLKFAIICLLDKIQINQNFIIITDNLAVKKDKNKQSGAIKSGIREYLRSKNLNVRYDIFHHSSASSVNLQIVDYINWAISRKYERGETKFYDKISKYILDEEVMTKDREERYY